jgi:hypothetical protein
MSMNFPTIFSSRKLILRTVSEILEIFYKFIEKIGKFLREIHKVPRILYQETLLRITLLFNFQSQQSRSVSHNPAQTIFIHSTRISRSRNRCEHNVIKPKLYQVPHSIVCELSRPGDSVCEGGSVDGRCKCWIHAEDYNDITITIMDLPTAEEESIMIEEMQKTFDVSKKGILRKI